MPVVPSILYTTLSSMGAPVPLDSTWTGTECARDWSSSLLPVPMDSTSIVVMDALLAILPAGHADRPLSVSRVLIEGFQ